MTHSKEWRRIEAALANQSEAELRWALAECELRKKYRKGHSDRWYQIKKRILKALADLKN